MRLSEMIDNPACLDYLQRCRAEIVKSGRARVYVTMLSGIAHMGRLPEFDERSYGKFLKEAEQQHFSVSQLEKALETILETSGPNDIMPNAAAAFEFLSFIADFVSAYAVHVGASSRLCPLTEKINAMALVAFAVAVSAEFGINEDLWRSGE